MINMTFHPQFSVIRQLLIGMGLGVVLIIIISLFISSHDVIGDVQFDSEKIEVITERSEKDTTTEQNSPVIDPEYEAKASQFSQFSDNKISLSTPQINAINNNTPRLSIVLLNIGKNRKTIAKILELMPSAVTIALAPYLDHHDKVNKQFREYEFETWFNMAALINDDTIDRGDLALNPVHNFSHNINALSSQIEGKPGITGLILPANSLIVETPNLWEDIVEDLYADGYAILDGTSKIMKPGLFFHDGQKAPYIKDNLTIKKTITNEDLISTLDSVTNQTLELNNSIISIEILTPSTLDILSDWINSLEGKGITLIPLSAQVKL